MNLYFGDFGANWRSNSDFKFLKQVKLSIVQRLSQDHEKRTLLKYTSKSRNYEKRLLTVVGT